MTERSAPRAAAAVLGLLLCAAPTRAAGGDLVHVGFLPGRDELVVATSGGSVFQMSYPGLRVIRQLEGVDDSGLTGIAVSGSGLWLAADYGAAGTRIWNLETGVEQLTIPRGEGLERPIVSILPDDDTLLQIGGRGPRPNPVFLFHPLEDTLLIFRGTTLERWDVARASPGEAIRAVRWVTRMSISPHGRYLAIEGRCRMGSRSFGLCVYQLEQDVVLSAADPQPLLGETPAIEELAYLADHRIAIRLKTYQLGGMLLLGHTLFLSPGELREIDTRFWGDADPEDRPAYRLAPQRQLHDTTADGSRKVRGIVESEQLCLWEVDASIERAGWNRECVPLP